MPNSSSHPRTDSSGRKHRTKAEKESREGAAKAFERTKPPKLTPPAWLGKKAKEIWIRKVKEIAGLQQPDALLDILDGDVLAVYCDNIASYMDLARKNGSTTIEEHKIKQTYTLRIIGAAERLGFTPASRARLIGKRAAGENIDPFGEEVD